MIGPRIVRDAIIARLSADQDGWLPPDGRAERAAAGDGRTDQGNKPPGPWFCPPVFELSFFQNPPALFKVVNYGPGHFFF